MPFDEPRSKIMTTPRASVLMLFAVFASAGCDPAVTRRFDVRLSDRPPAKKWEQSAIRVEGELAEVVQVMDDVAAKWDFWQDRLHVDPDEQAAEAAGEMGRDRTVGKWYRADPDGAGLSLWCRLEANDRARVYLVRAIHSKESPLMRDIRHDLTAPLIERFGADRVRVTGHMDKQSLRR
jgi:hypothetical protein